MKPTTKTYLTTITMINKTRQIQILLMSICISIPSIAQDWYKAKIQTPTQDSYYLIDLPNEVIALSGRNDLLDLRIVDANGKEYPYFVKQKMEQHEVSNLESFKLLENSTIKGNNRIRIHNIDKKTINDLLISAKTAEVNCSIDVKGSNNKTDWYIVKQKMPLRSSSDYLKKNNINDIFEVEIPSGDYEYYELNITNTQKAPLDINEVYWIKETNNIPELSSVNTGKTEINDSLKQTIISFPNLEYDYHVSMIKLYLDNKENYKRIGRIQYSKDQFIPFQISSTKDGINEIRINKTIKMSNNFKIIVENGDNLPLVIDSLACYNKKFELCTFLTGNTNYFLTIQEKNNIPNYDIVNFESEIPNDLSTLQISNIEKEDRPTPIPPVRDKMWIENPIVMWSIILLVGILLLFICSKMIKDLKNKDRSKKQ